MTLRLRTPELIPTLATFVVVAITMWLGVWQLQRLHWKTQLIATIEQAQSQAPRDILSYKPDEIEKAQWHNAVAQGVLLHRKEFHATPRYYKGLLGYAILTPLAISTKQGTQYVLVNRGWVPPEHKDPATRAEGNPLGKVIVEGAIRTAFTQGKFTPDNRPDTNLWFWYDISAMSKNLGLPLLPILIDATAVRNEDGTAIQDGPLPFPIEINIRNDHKGYAITWFLIGLAAIGVYLAYYIERKPSGSEASRPSQP